jgi:tRNA 2-selenouridine synthase
MPDIEVIDRVDPPTLAAFDAIIDVRSPSEFAEDHVPGAVNLPVLDDAERAAVGTIYVQESRLRARRVGAALVARNVARHLETALEGKPGGFRPLVYCWRGGQRSGAMATILAQVGWRTAVLAGGYKTYRRHVQARLYEEEGALPLVLLGGRTGSGKTQLLALLEARGVQTLDLEALAEHRGSVFGDVGHPQPSQKLFESRLLAALDALDPSRPILVEAEASKIGDRMAPPMLWKAMTAAPRIVLTVPNAVRASYLAGQYAHVVADRAAFEAALLRLPVHIGGKTLEAWRGHADAGDLEALALGLIEAHYDPAYDRADRKAGRPATLASVEMAGLEPADLDVAAQRIEALLAGAPELRSRPDR